MFETRKSIEEQFKTQEGRIVSPGKYDGSPIYTPYFASKSERRGKAMHSIRDEDVVQFPELKGYKVVCITTLDDGRITAEAFANADYW